MRPGWPLYQSGPEAAIINVNRSVDSVGDAVAPLADNWATKK